MKFTALIIISIFLLISCSPSNKDIDYIKSTGWTHSSGYSAGAYLNFTKTSEYSIRGDTIFYNNSPKAIIISLHKIFYDLKIASLDGKQTGHYRDENEMFE